MVFGLFSEPIVPGEAVANHEAAQDVVRAEYTNNTEREEGQGDAKGQEGLVIDETTRFSSRSVRNETDVKNELVLLSEPQNLARNIADHSAYDARKQDLIQDDVVKPRNGQHSFNILEETYHSKIAPPWL